ncbi:MAG: hypothetical protein HQK75_07125 [Candidatus Magnetomorum sp.]|nr:hypothetical protein [Candidatus Magnetomorum sp.]
MRRLITLTGMITVIALFNMGGCGGSDSINGFKPSINQMTFFKNPEKNPQVNAYTQGDDGVIVVTISDYDLNADTIEVQVDQCTTAACDTSTPYHTEGPHSLSQQMDVRFTYTFPNFIKSLPATHYYSFTVEVIDREGQSDTKTSILQVNTGYAPTIDNMIFYHKTYPGILLDSWNSSTYYNFTVEITAQDLDLNVYQYYVERNLKDNAGNIIKTSPKIGPIRLADQTTQDFVLKIEAIKDGNITSSLMEGFTNQTGALNITVELEDTLSNSAQISRSITLTQ